MEHHEHEERELVGDMERTIATAMSTVGSLVEAYFRARARRGWAQNRTTSDRDTDRTTGVDVRDPSPTPSEPSTELAVPRQPGAIWESAEYGQLVDHELRTHGVDPSRIGDADQDRAWMLRADGGDIIDTYRAADRWASRSEQAHQMRDNIAAELSDYGLDLNELLAQPRDQAAEQVVDARAQWWADNGADKATADTEADRDGERITGMLGDADQAERIERDTAQRSDDARDAADGLVVDDEQNTPPPRPGDSGAAVEAASTLTRAERVAEYAGTTAAGRAAAIAAVSHPTHPRDAANAKTKDTTHPKAGRAASVGRQKGRGL
ncbi:hypothetical protein [Williamsia sterculiae]|uniref:Uncharacterized protein n=1 Tax=Williamsia sterculiae TaxID=1344003 RepID=A0A1N7HEK6_9NOCA|nr:hypothetical protein [Williamsia sterculiae]SIS23193.1 hypothetical protein SAMN05445060_4074 [Williamsia sterculiae]